MVERKPGLDARAKAARVEAVAHLGADAERFRAAIDRYVLAVEVADQARREWDKLGRPLWTKGSQGQFIEHPLVRTMDRMERAAATFADTLGLTPARRFSKASPGSPRPLPTRPSTGRPSNLGSGRGMILTATRPGRSATAPVRHSTPSITLAQAQTADYPGFTLLCASGPRWGGNGIASLEH
jgi:hypothetical protein